MKHWILTLGLLFSISAIARAADWPMYRADAARSGYTAESLPAELSLRWTYRSTHPPRPAWPRSSRMTYDRAQHTVISGGMVFFGNSVDGKVYALDAATGRQKWTFFTDGPVRFAAAVWQDRVFVVSDDGYLYALAKSDGRLLWRRRGGSDNTMVLGNQRMISKWPARGGPVVMDGVVYYAAGIWPSEGIYVYALDAITGEQRWRNDRSGEIYMPQPHGGANAKSGISVQGYLVAWGDRLLVPTGRAVPASLDRHTGKLQYYHMQKYGHTGGTAIMAVSDMFYNGGLAFSANTGHKKANMGNGPVAAAADGLVSAGEKTIFGYQWTEIEKSDRKGNTVKIQALRKLWSVPITTPCSALIVAGERVVAGSDGHVDVIDVKAQKVVWSSQIEGTAHGLAYANGRLLVSTGRGTIYCFDASGEQAAPNQNHPAQEEPSAKDAAKAAEEIIRRSGITEGYCLDLGCGDGALALELARRTKLRILAVDNDPEQVNLARKRLEAAGLYGSRVMVHQRDLAITGYPKYFANLIVSGRSVMEGAKAAADKEADRLQRPYGGVICLGTPGAMKMTVRGPLEGAGSWTHQYADPANQLCSDDRLVKGRLSMFWFRDIDFEIPSRHGRGPAPLFHQGRLYHEGIDGLAAVDAYNGRVLWKYEIKGILRAYHGHELMGIDGPGTSGTGSNYCAWGDSIYIRQGSRCLRLDAASGKLLGEFAAPERPGGGPGTWGYIACDEEILYGSVANNKHVITSRFVSDGGDMTKQLTESLILFAMDASSGKLLWKYRSVHSIRHNTIAIAAGKVFLIDRPQAKFDRVSKPESKDHPTGTLLALNSKTGQVMWQNDQDIYGTVLAANPRHGALLMSYQPDRFRLASEIGGRMTVFQMADGNKLWEVQANYESRPLINDQTIYAQGGAWDLLTGETRPFNFKRSYGCGILSGCTNMLLFRSATLGYFDLTQNRETENYGGMRPGCWINAIPAGGIVLVPDASASCTCSYQNRSWIALQPASEN